MAKAKHLHTYERIKGRPEYFRCIHPECNHYIHRDLLPNKLAMCKCNTEFILTPQQLKLKSPHCDDCTNPKRGRKSTREKSIVEILVTDPNLKDVIGA